MNQDRSNDYGYLDRIRIDGGAEKCRAVFTETCRTNRRRAAALLNDRRVTFPCLFLLMPQIESLRAYPWLNARNTLALGIVRRILDPEGSGGRVSRLSVRNESVHSVLKWIVETGGAEDGMDEDYEEVLDIAVSVLADTYQDKSVLPFAEEMIFRRGKKGHNIHDLVWAVFRIRDPEVLRRIAAHLRSPDTGEAGLAHSLLNPEASCGARPCADPQQEYDDYIRWLDENDPFLYFTGESFQLTGEPAVCRVDLERKYMCKGSPSYEKEPAVPSDDRECRCLEAFRTLGGEEKRVLSEYSCRVHGKDASEWEKWMDLPVGEQIRAAKNRPEGWK